MPDEITNSNPEQAIDVSALPDTLPVEDVKGLKTAYQKLKEELEAAKKQAALATQYESVLGTKSPEELARIKLTAEQSEQREREQAALMSRVKSEVEREWSERYQQLDVTAKTYQQQLDSLRKENAIQAEFNRFGGKAAGFQHFYKVAGDRIQYDPSTNQAVILGDDGKPVYDDGKPLTLSQFIQKSKNDQFLGHYFEPESKATGGGSFSLLARNADGKPVIGKSDMSNFIRQPGNAEKIARGEVRVDYNQ